MRRQFLGYLVAVLWGVAIGAVHESFQPILQHQSPTLILIIAVLAASAYGGLGPGLVAVLLCEAIAGYDFYRASPDYILTPVNQLRVILFAVEGIAVSVVIDALKRNIERRRLAEQTVRELNDSLERRVAERTAQLKDVNSALETLAYSVAEDLRSPLGVMQEQAETLHTDYAEALDNKGVVTAARLAAASERVAALVQELLEFSQLTHQELVLERVDLADVLAEVRKLLDRPLRDGRAMLTVERPLGAVMGHPAALLHVISTILMHALQDGGDVPPAIHIYTTPARDARGLQAVRFCVEHAAGSASPEAATGPLPRVRQTVERLGGRMGAETTNECICRWWIELPTA